ncbi:MAG TPA: hypothetical protein VFZ66_26480 [Herpetosiphonaceae bacterium]
MIGTLPMAALAPLDYRYALDGARTLFEPHATPLIRCHAPELAAEVAQRFPAPPPADASAGALWIEPLVPSWGAELADLARQLPVGARLVVLVSQPLARMLPERRAWSGQPLGMRLLGLRDLRHALRKGDLVIETTYGIHSAASIALSQVSQQAARLSRPDLADRLHFAARLRYHTQGPLSALATVALLVARKEQGARKQRNKGTRERVS